MAINEQLSDLPIILISCNIQEFIFKDLLSKLLVRLGGIQNHKKPRTADGGSAIEKWTEGVEN